MELLIIRDAFADEYTLGILTVDGKDFGFTVEDQDRGLNTTHLLSHIEAVKVKDETAIPCGRYRVATTWSNKYQRKMPLVLDVPGFRGIRIHAGNNDDHTSGCILPGTTRSVAGVSNSKPACEWLYCEIAKVEAAGGDVWLTIRRAEGTQLAPKYGALYGGG